MFYNGLIFPDAIPLESTDQNDVNVKWDIGVKVLVIMLCTDQSQINKYSQSFGVSISYSPISPPSLTALE